LSPLAVHQILVQAGFAGRKLTNATSVGVDPDGAGYLRRAGRSPLDRQL
jgi:hypothetical protein